MTETPFRIAVGIPTTGRAEVLVGTLRSLQRQTRAPDRIVVCYASSNDVQPNLNLPGVELICAPAGLPRQRNAIIDAVPDCDALLFLDDDFVPAPKYLEATIAALQADQGIVVTTGRVIADGVNGPGLRHETALALVTADRYHGPWPGISRALNGYGCNMAIRLSTVRALGLRFDERLPLYGWWEDVDFTRRLGRSGRIVRVAAAGGVHLGVKSGRTSGLRLGYSQIANPFYLLAKGSVPLGYALQMVGRHVAKNLVRSLWPEPYTDRRGRFRGNTLAMLDLVRGRMRPERILDLRSSSR